MTNRAAGYMLLILAYAGAGGLVLDQLSKQRELTTAERVQAVVIGPPLVAFGAIQQFVHRTLGKG